MTVEIYVHYEKEGKHPHYTTYRFDDLDKAREFEYRKLKYNKTVKRYQKVFKK